MLKDCAEVNNYYKQQKMSNNEKQNWVSFDVIQQKYNELLEEVKPMLLNKSNINFQTIIKYEKSPSARRRKCISP